MLRKLSLTGGNGASTGQVRPLRSTNLRDLDQVTKRVAPLPISGGGAKCGPVEIAAGVTGTARGAQAGRTARASRPKPMKASTDTPTRATAPIRIVARARPSSRSSAWRTAT